MSTTTAQPTRHRWIRGFGHFALHFFEMCMPDVHRLGDR
jgi:hypothetical protein